jgi:mannose-1-phosphate guanylyltransferase
LIHAIILAGGRGTRFWPLSRETRPKQMLHIVGEDTLLRQTIKRLDGFHPLVNIWIVTVKSLAEDIRFHLQPLEKDAEKVHFIIAPFGKNAAPAIGLAALILNKISPNSIMVVMPSDHSIKSIKQFQEKL